EAPSANDTMQLPSTAARNFDAAAVPLVFDSARQELTNYAVRADFKAVAISIDGWGASFGAVDQESAKREALERCSGQSKRNMACRIYAVGMNVVWKDGSLLLPVPADIHDDPLDIPLTADALPITGDQDRQFIDAHLKLPGHKAYAIKSILPIQG